MSVLSIDTIPRLLRRLWRHITPHRRGQLGLLMGLMIAASFAEVLSIGAVLPFLGVLSAPEQVFGHPAAQPLINLLSLTEPVQLLLPLTIGFVVAAVIAGSMRLLLVWVSTRLSFAIGADLSTAIYHRTLYQPYAIHVARNSSEVIAGISQKAVILVNGAIQPVLTLISSALLTTAVMVALISIDPFVALTAVAGFGSIYALILRITKRRLQVDSQHVARESTQVIQALQEGLGGIRDVLLGGMQETYRGIYQGAVQRMQRAQGNMSVIAQSPRFVIESLGMVLIAWLTYLMVNRPGGVASAIPVLGALALGAQRLLPVMQLAYTSLSTLRGNQASVRDALDLLDQPLPAYADHPRPEPMEFQEAIALHRLSFRYTPEAPWILHDLDLTIPKGSRVGFIGTTGTGKSTVTDLIIALLQPTEGHIEVDGIPVTLANLRAWQAHIAHVPQAIFLADTSIEENIAFGVPKDGIDPDRVRQAARQAQIADTIESWSQQYQTRIGERGVRLSGGQRQRIGIARALYKRADVIVFDEATSALDNETEAAVMHAIQTMGDHITILIIAHRLTTLKDCDLIVELSEGSIGRIGSYADIVSRAAELVAFPVPTTGPRGVVSPTESRFRTS